MPQRPLFSASTNDMGQTFSRESKEILMDAPVCIFWTTPEGRFLTANHTAARKLGYDTPEELTNSVQDIASEIYADPKDREELMRLLAERDKVEDFECRLLRRDGSDLWVSHNIQAIRDGEGNISHFQVFTLDITERKKTEEALRESETRNNILLNSVPDLMFVTNPQGVYLECYGSDETLFAARPDQLVGRSIHEILPRDVADACFQALDRAHKTGDTQIVEYSTEVRSGPRSFEARITPMDDRRLLTIVRDITQRKQAEQALRESERRFRQEKEYLDNLIQNSADAVIILDEHGRIIRGNKQAHVASGYSFQEIQGVHFSQFHADHKEMEHMLAELREKGSVQDYEISFITKSGQAVPCSISVSTIYDDFGQLLGSINILRDLTEWKRTQQKLEEMSLHDTLTGLYSRSFFEEEMNRLANNRYCPIGLLISDINGLKLINDTMGHDKGDELIQATGRILKECFRGSDIIARIGGDEFAVLLPESGPSILQTCCQRIRQKVASFNEQNPEFGLSISIGHAIEEEPPPDMNTLFKKADDAMYKEKLQESYSSRNDTIQALIRTLEARDHITEGHAERLSDYAQKLGRSLYLSEERLHDLRLLARFHDLGKAGVPDRVLFKPLPLSKDEYEEIKRHSEIGHRIALSTSDLAPIADLILKHHEWWDGGGYPLGLAGEDIPLECRILAIVDAYDAMTSRRPHRNPMSQEEVIQELRRCAGIQFDPELVETFIRIVQE